MRFQPADRPPLMELGAWDSTQRIWAGQTGRSGEAVMNWMDERDETIRVVPDFSMRPPFEEKVLAEDAQTFTIQDKMGLAYRQFKDAPDRSMPDYVAFPVKTRDDWEAIKKRLDPTDPGRYPADWPEQVAGWRERQPIACAYGLVMNYYGGPSLFGFCRMLLGAERLLYAFYDEPEMVEDMMEFSTEFAITMLRKALAEAPLTYVQLWEDMCFCTGPLMSPEMFKRLMVPRYKRIVEVIRSAGIDVIFVDSDGDVSQLVPLWLEAGINGVFPMEQAAGNDIHEYRRQYGKDLLMMGGLDKRALLGGRDAIDAELAAKIPLAFEGGYVPTLDHWIPPDISYDNFMYYWQRKREMLGA
jgi:uroporphyrinogen decarboxylase